MDTDEFKFKIFVIGIIIVVFGIGYWAFTSLDTGKDFAIKQREQLIDYGAYSFPQTEEEELEEILEDIKEQPEEEVEEEPLDDAQDEEPEPDTPNEHQDLIDALDKLIADNIVMKKGSKGTRVGTVQRFLNMYNNIDDRVDNDYGDGTKEKVKGFQKAEGLSADGQAGPGTYAKMIQWLEDNF